MKTPCLFLICLFLASCAQIYTSVENFSNLPVEYVGKKVVVILDYPEETGKSSEWIFNKRIFENHFIEQGFLISNLDVADYVASVTYRSGAPEERTYNESRDRYRQVLVPAGSRGYDYEYNEATSGYVRVKVPANDEYEDQVVGTDYYTIISTVYTRTIEVNLVEKGSNKKIFESKAMSTGSCNAIDEVMEKMADSIFKKFPSGSGLVSLDMVLRECITTRDVEVLTHQSYH